jgi:hypothetical protein
MTSLVVEHLRPEDVGASLTQARQTQHLCVASLLSQNHAAIRGLASSLLRHPECEEHTAQEIDGRFLSDIDEGSADAEEPNGLNGALLNEDAPSRAYLIAGMETPNNLATSLLE